MDGNNDIFNLKMTLNRASELKNSGFESNSLLSSYQEKINENIENRQEIISLQTQLKMIKEQLKLQEAEFAFQKNELIEEINHLRGAENNLRSSVTKLEKGKVHDQYDVKVKLLKNVSSTEDLENRIKADKVKKTKLKEENKSLKDRVLHLIDEISTLKSTNSSVLLGDGKNTSDLIDTYETNSLKKSNSLSENSSIKNQLDQIQNQEDNLESLSSIHKEKLEYQKEIDNLKQQIIKLKEENANLLKNFNENETAKFDDLQKENSKLKSKIENTQVFNSALDKLEAETINQKNLIDHITYERDTLANLLRVNPGPIEEDWVDIQKAVGSALESQRALRQVQLQNEKLKSRLKSFLETSPTQKTEEKVDSNVDEYEFELREKIKKLQIQDDEKNDRIAKLQTQIRFSFAIDRTNASLIRSINSIHSALYPENSGIRPLFLAIIFAHRFMKYKDNDSYFDQNALQIFGPRPAQSPEAKISQIRLKLESLTQTLVESKQRIIELEQANRVLEDENGNLMVQAHTFHDERKFERKKTRLLKRRISELQQELALQVSPDDYTIVCDRIRDLELKYDEATKQIKRLKEERGGFDGEIEKMKSEIAEMEQKMAENDDLTRAAMSNVASKEKEIETLTILVSEKTKEILALERIVQRQKQLGKTAVSAFTTLELGEKDQLDFEPRLETATMCQPERTVPIKINPAFL